MRFCPRCGTRYEDDLPYCPEDGAATQVLEQETTKVDPLLGQTIDGRYRVEKQIGEGGMGLVYLATHAAIGKKLALKVLRADMARDQDVVQRFIQEAQSATAIGHENIVDISDFGKLPDGSVYFVMEFLDGEALTDLIRRGGSVPVKDAVSIIRQIASALAAAHARGIVHRDLKPDNIYLLRRGAEAHFVKVLDFGIAKVGGASSKLTRTGMVFGTPHYMSPEQAAGQGVDQRTDIYALGVIMYEMFAGHVPFDADTFMGILTKHMFEQPPALSATGNRALGAIEDVTMKALKKKTEERYQSMGELIEDLDRVSAGGTVHIGSGPGITTPSGLADALEPMSRTEMRLSVDLPGLTQRKQNRTMWIVAGVLLVVGVGGAIAFLSMGSHQPPTSVATTNAGPPPPVHEAVPPVPAPAEPAPPSAPKSIALSSDPSGAEVLVAGATVGNTPLQLPLPTAGEQPVELRLPGHASKSVMLSPASPTSLSVHLDAVAVIAPPVPAADHKTHPVHAHPTAPSGGHAPAAASSSGGVVDPWN